MLKLTDFSRYTRREQEIAIKSLNNVRKAVARREIHRLQMNKKFLAWAGLSILALIYFDQLNMPMSVGELWWADSPVGAMLVHAIPFFIFSSSWNMLIAWRINRGISERLVAATVYKVQMQTNVRAAVMEELIYRFMMLLSLAYLFTVLNNLLGGANDASKGALARLYTNGGGEIIDSLFYGILSDNLQAAGFALTFAALISTFWFAIGHFYDGWLGLMHAWWLGWGFVYLTLNHGLIVAMTVHLLHNGVISTIHYLDTHWDTRHMRLAHATALHY